MSPWFVGGLLVAGKSLAVLLTQELRDDGLSCCCLGYQLRHTGRWCRDRVARYRSGLTDAQWELLRPDAERVMAQLRQATGRPMMHDLRAVLDAVFYVVCNGI